MEILLEVLVQDGQLEAVKYLVAAQAPASLKISEFGVYSSRWESSFRRTVPSKSTFTSNLVESQWRVEDVCFPNASVATQASIFGKVNERSARRRTHYMTDKHKL